MSDVDMDAIRLRHKEREQAQLHTCGCGRGDWEERLVCRHDHDYEVVSDVATLFAEIDRLNDEIFNLNCEWREHVCQED